MTTEVQTYVGIDVSKDKLDVAVWGETTITQVANTPKGIASLIQYSHPEKSGSLGIAVIPARYGG